MCRMELHFLIPVTDMIAASVAILLPWSTSHSLPFTHLLYKKALSLFSRIGTNDSLIFKMGNLSPDVIY